MNPRFAERGRARPARRLRPDGQVAVVFVLLLVVLIGIAGALVDGGSWLLDRRNLQGAADSAALAGVRELPYDQAAAAAIAGRYATEVNPADDARVRSIDVDETTITVSVERDGNLYLTQAIGRSSPTIGAHATAQVLQVLAPIGMLPLALIRGSFETGEQIDVKTLSGWRGNHGAIRPPMGEDCTDANGANDFRDLIVAARRGGYDACGIVPGDTVQTETGNMSGPTRTGFAERIGDNVQSIDDVYDCGAGYTGCVATDVESPRIGVVPVIESLDGRPEWPNGSADVRVVEYVWVYIGKTDSPPTYPAETDNGKTVWITPVELVELPAGWDALFADGFDPSSSAPLAYRLVD